MLDRYFTNRATARGGGVGCLKKEEPCLPWPPVRHRLTAPLLEIPIVVFVKSLEDDGDQCHNRFHNAELKCGLGGGGEGSKAGMGWVGARAWGGVGRPLTCLQKRKKVME